MSDTPKSPLGKPFSPAPSTADLASLSYKLADRFLEKFTGDMSNFNALCREVAMHKFAQTDAADKFQFCKKSKDLSRDRWQTLLRESHERVCRGTGDTHHAMSSVGGILIGDLTQQMAGLIQEDYGSDVFPESALTMMFPDSVRDAAVINYDVFAAPGGAIEAYSYGSGVQQIAQLANRTVQFTGTPYRAYMEFPEEQILFQRLLGAQPYDQRGILQRIAFNIMKFRVQIHNRKQLIRSTIFANGATIIPVTGSPIVISYGIPQWNIVTNFTGQPWGTIDSGTGTYTVNPLSDPAADFLYYLNAYEPWLTRQSRINGAGCKIVMNPRTMAVMISSPSVRDRLVALQTSASSPVSAVGTYTADNIIKSLIPGFEGEFIVDRSGYLLEDSSVSWDLGAGEFTSTAPGQAFFIPDGQVMFYFTPNDAPLGEFIMQPQLQNGGIQAPKGGEWIVPQPLVGPQFPDGLTRPSYKIVGGMQAGLAPIHVEDVFIGNFVTVV